MSESSTATPVVSLIFEHCEVRITVDVWPGKSLRHELRCPLCGEEVPWSVRLDETLVMCPEGQGPCLHTGGEPVVVFGEHLIDGRVLPLTFLRTEPEPPSTRCRHSGAVAKIVGVQGNRAYATCPTCGRACVRVHKQVGSAGWRFGAHST